METFESFLAEAVKTGDEDRTQLQWEIVHLVLLGKEGREDARKIWEQFAPK